MLLETPSFSSSPIRQILWGWANANIWMMLHRSRRGSKLPASRPQQRMDWISTKCSKRWLANLKDSIQTNRSRAKTFLKNSWKPTISSWSTIARVSSWRRKETAASSDVHILFDEGYTIWLVVYLIWIIRFKVTIARSFYNKEWC